MPVPATHITDFEISDNNLPKKVTGNNSSFQKIVTKIYPDYHELNFEFDDWYAPNNVASQTWSLFLDNGVSVSNVAGTVASNVISFTLTGRAISGADNIQLFSYDSSDDRWSAQTKIIELKYRGEVG